MSQFYTATVYLTSEQTDARLLEAKIKNALQQDGILVSEVMISVPQSQNNAAFTESNQFLYRENLLRARQVLISADKLLDWAKSRPEFVDRADFKPNLQAQIGFIRDALNSLNELKRADAVPMEELHSVNNLLRGLLDSELESVQLLAKLEESK